MLFPEFQPPSTHARSRSISTPKWMRFSDSSERLQTVNCLIAMMLKAVGMTQLAEPEIQGQPYLSGSKRTLRSAVLNFHRQNQWPSRPLVLRSQDSPRSRAFDGSLTEFNAQTARAVVHEDSRSPTKDGQLPSASCTPDKSLPSRSASEGLSASRQRIAKDVASKLTCREPKKLHPPPRSSRPRNSSRRPELLMSRFCRKILQRSSELPSGAQNSDREGRTRGLLSRR